MTKTNLYERFQVAFYGGTAAASVKPPETPPPAGAPVSRFDQQGQHAERLYASPYNHAIESCRSSYARFSQPLRRQASRGPRGLG